MDLDTVGVRELKTQLSRYLLRVKGGATLVVTEHGRPVARIVPVPPDPEERLRGMVDAGLVEWSGRKLVWSDPEAVVRSNSTVADILLADRE